MRRTARESRATSLASVVRGRSASEACVAGGRLRRQASPWKSLAHASSAGRSIATAQALRIKSRMNALAGLGCMPS